MSNSSVTKGRRYCWRITDDLFSETSKGDKSMVGISGPSDADHDSIRGTDRGIRFRLLDDDGEVYVIGRFWGDASSEDAFGPLEDFGTPALGATTIQYWDDRNGWETI